MYVFIYVDLIKKKHKLSDDFDVRLKADLRKSVSLPLY